MRKLLLLTSTLLLSVSTTAFAASHLVDKQPYENSSHHEDTKGMWGVKFDVSKASLYSNKAKYNFATRFSFLLFKEWLFGALWGVKVLGGYSEQGGVVGSSLVKVTRRKPLNSFRTTTIRSPNPFETTTIEKGNRIIIVPYAVLGIIPRFYLEEDSILSLFMGPWLGYRNSIRTQVIYKGEEARGDDSLGKAIVQYYEECLSKLNSGILLGLDINLDSGLLLGVDFNIGLMNISKEIATKLRTYSLGFTFGYKF